jgi:hypothetical protein
MELDLDVQQAAENHGCNHGYDERVNDPGFGTARPGRASWILDLDEEVGEDRAEPFLARVL